MKSLSMAEFCRVYGLPQHRFSRWKKAFALTKKEGYKNDWVLITAHNLNLVEQLKRMKGTKPRAERLTIQEFEDRHGVTMQYLTKVFHRLDITEDKGRVLLHDTRKNLTLLKFGRIFRRA